MYYGRRRQQRRAAFPLGRSTFGKIFVEGAFIRSCKLHDISEGGACLRVHHVSDLPEKFHLILDGVACRKSRRLVWRRLDNIVVAFTADEQTGATHNATA